MLQWDDLRVFVTLARSESVREAALHLNVSHSTVIRRIEHAERQLGIQLFLKRKEGYKLTSDGDTIFKECSKIEDRILTIERLAANSSDASARKLVVTMPDVFATHYLSQYFDVLQRLFPDLLLKFEFTNDIVDLSRAKSDIAIRFSNSPHEWLIGKRLSPTRESIYASPAYLSCLDSAKVPIPPRFVSWRSREVGRCKTFGQHKTQWELNNVNVQLAACEMGMGYVQLPCYVGDMYSAIQRVPNSKTYKGQDIWMLYHEDLKSTPKIDIFRKFLTSTMKRDQNLFLGNIGKE